MCSADVVGFHAFDHARHFLNATKRMLGIRSGSRPGGLLTLNVQDREVIVTVSHVSIETLRIAQAAAHPETQRIARELREKHAGKRIIAGIDVCQRLSGVALKFAAFDKMLSDSSWGKRGNVVLLQRCIRGGSRPGDEETTASDLRKMVDDINGKYVTSAAAALARMSAYASKSSEECLLTAARMKEKMEAGETGSGAGSPFPSTSPFPSPPPSPFPSPSPASASGSASTSVIVTDTSPTPAPPAPTCLDVLDYAELTSPPNIHERMAFWLVSDVILLTPIREGLNLYPLEYIYARRDLPNPGVVVVSEFSTCSALLNGSLKINPFAPLHVADALEKALMLSTKDKDLRRTRDLPFISSHPSYLWTQQIINDLEQLQNNSSGGKGAVQQLQYPVPLDTKSLLSCYENAVK
jgi:trehalose-6-phosphate synthase